MSDLPSVRNPSVPEIPTDRWPNTMAFPQSLRDAIPDLPACSGRVLVLDSFDLHSTNTDLAGPRVGAILQVKETGRLNGRFDILLDLKADAARVLAQKLMELADEAEKRPAEPFYRERVVVDRKR